MSFRAILSKENNNLMFITFVISVNYLAILRLNIALNNWFTIFFLYITKQTDSAIPYRGLHIDVSLMIA
jgi:hypothetical protein